MRSKLIPLVALAALATPTSVAFAQQSAALFDAPVIQLPDDSPPFQKLFDYDGDGDMDAVGSRLYTSGSAYQVSVWRNDNGHYVLAFNHQQSMTATSSSKMAITTGDFDDDGDQDFVVGPGSAIVDFRNNNGSWSTSTTSMPQKISDLVTGDFDGDGKDDTAILMPTSMATSELRIRLSSGGTVSHTTSTFTLGARLEALDVDADAHDEIGVWHPFHDRMKLFDYAAPAIQALPPLIITSSNTQPYRYWSSGDIDGDGDCDVIAFELLTLSSPAHVHCFRRVTANTFAPEPAYLGGPAEFLADADGDGDLDGVCCGGGGSPSSWPMLNFSSTYEIALNDGTGVLAPSFALPGRGSRQMAGVADVDLDGDLDLVAGCAVYYSQGELTAANSPPAGWLAAGIVSGFEMRTLRTQVDDFDRDGDIDFLSTPTEQAHNDGSGSFTLSAHDPAVIPAGFTAGVPRFRGDFDGDGAADFVLPLFDDVSGAFAHMAYLRNNGSGHLSYAGAAAPAGQQIGNQPAPHMTMRSSPLTADLDGDGDIDIVVSADARWENPYHSEVWWNQGGGQFVAGPSMPTERTEAVADFDSDGTIDLLVRTFDGVPSIRLGTGQPNNTFGASLPVLPALPGFGYSIEADSFVVADANDDGRPDLVVVEDNGLTQNRMRLYCNTTITPGNPTFQVSPGPLGLSLSPHLLANAIFFDINGDGRTDLLDQGADDRVFATKVYIRTSGDGAVLTSAHFEPAVEQVIWDGFPGDVDGDGDLDVIGTFVVRNLKRPSATGGLRQQYGDATAGEAGIAPLLGASGSIQAGETTLLQLSGVTGPTVGVLALSLAPTSLPNVPPGALCLVEPTLAILGTWPLPVPGAGNARGHGQLSITLPLGIHGFDIYEQVFVFDVAAPQAISASNGLHIRVGGSPRN